jgi:hypothetical protein
MSEIINRIDGFSPLSHVGNPHRAAAGSGSHSAPPIRDTVEFSSFGRALAEAAERSTFRLAHLRAVRDEIDRGDYETTERLTGTVERLLDVIG